MPGSAAHILVCEDEAALRADIAAVLREAGYTVSEAADGAAARGLLETVMPDLVLCDISMPRLGGLELLSHVRQTRPDLAEVPFLFLTALVAREQVLAGKSAGADDYLVKPIDHDIMLATVAAHLRQVARMRASLEDRVARMREALRSGNAYPMLDSLALAVVLLDADGRIVHANAAAGELVREFGQVLRDGLSSGAAAAHRTVGRASANDDQPAVLRVATGDDRPDLIVLLSQLPTAEPAMMALLIDPANRMVPPDTLLQSLFGLTSTEARVASLLAQGNRSEEIAGGLGIRQSTVIFHLRNIFAKTGTNRQVDLVVLLLSLMVAPQ